MRIFLIFLITILVDSCSPRPIAGPHPTQIPLSTEAPLIMATPDLQPDRMVSLAMADLSTRLSPDRQQVRVLSVEPARWPDAALGCPRPGETYAEQAEPGYRIVLEANGQIYEYRTDTSKTVILCDAVVEESSSTKDMDQNVVDGWPNETKNKDVIFATPIR